MKNKKTNWWKVNIAQLVMESAIVEMVPDVDVPVDEAVDSLKHKCLKGKDEMVRTHQSRMLLKDIDPVYTV